MIETTLTEQQQYALKLSSINMNTNKYGSKSVVNEVMKEGEDLSSSHAVFVPSTTDPDLKRTTYKLIGQDKKKVIFSCEDIREKKKTIEDLKDRFIFYCTSSILQGMFPLRTMSNQKTEGHLKPSQENKIRMILVYNLFM